MDKARLFAALPYPLKKVVAAARGRHLESWRYDELTEARVAAALERESWSAERWRTWQEERLARLLAHAAREVPYYREMWSGRRRRGDAAAVEDLASWPVLEKEPLRRHPRAFLADGARGQRLFAESTSGSTGTPVSLYWDEETTRGWYALVEARCRRWHGLTRQDPWAILGGQPVAAASRRRPPFWVWNAAMSQLYLSSSHLAPDLIPFYLEAMREHGIRWLYGYGSALDTLASFGQGHAALGLELVMSNAEPLYLHQRERIAAAFACPVRETYGMAELVAAASECPAGGLHLWPEVGFAELEDGQGRVAPAAPGESGDLIATGLLNFAQPLVRYRLGDRLAFAPDAADEAGRCACGRLLPRLAAVDGRSDAVVITADGRRIGRLDPIFKGGLPLLEAQVVQETFERLRLRYVPAPGFSLATENELRRRFAARVGDLELVFEQVERLERTRGGKLRGVVSQLQMPSAQEVEAPSPERPKLSVILPVRNEEAFIERSLASILGQTLGVENLEILLVDGMSEDKTRERAAAMLSSHERLPWRILDNPGKTAPCAMNVGLRAARGAFVARVDGHSELESKYLEKAINLLDAHPAAAGVGGRLETLGHGAKAAVIAAAMSSSFGVGGAAFRLPGPPGSVVEADTVAFPVYRRRALEENGYFDETLVRNQDDEYNFRLRKRGWKILLAADLKVKYYSRAAFGKLWRQYYEYGVYKVRVLQKHPRQMSPRHFVPLLFVLALAATFVMAGFSPWPLLALVFLWGLAAAAASLELAAREKWGMAEALPRLFLLPWAFFLLHTAYGAGFAAGLLRFGRGFFRKEKT